MCNQDPFAIESYMRMFYSISQLTYLVMATPFNHQCTNYQSLYMIMCNFFTSRGLRSFSEIQKRYKPIHSATEKCEIQKIINNMGVFLFMQ